MEPKLSGSEISVKERIILDYSSMACVYEEGHFLRLH